MVRRLEVREMRVYKSPGLEEREVRFRAVPVLVGIDTVPFAGIVDAIGESPNVKQRGSC
jgi:hypothetical protein